MSDDPPPAISNGQPLLAARGLGRKRTPGEGWLLEDVSLAVDQGQRVALVGATGSGKTLLLRALALLDPLDAGEVCWRSQPVAAAQVPEYRSHAIYLHQRAPVTAGTVEANLRRPFGFAIHAHRQFDRDRIIALLAVVGRDDRFLSRNSRELSGGERQIVALLRAMQLEPQLLLLDEPTASLDADSTRAIEELVHGWQLQYAEERSFVWVSHDRQQVDRVAQRVLTMRAGRMIDETVQSTSSE